MTASFDQLSHADLRRVLNGTPADPVDELLQRSAQEALGRRTRAEHFPLQTERATPSTILKNILR